MIKIYRIMLRTDDGGRLEMAYDGDRAWLRIEPPLNVDAPIDSVNFRGRRRAALHAFAKKLADATAPRVVREGK